MASPSFRRLEASEQLSTRQLSQRLTRSLASPFGAWATPENRSTAIAILSVFGIIFLAGLIGHVCVVAYATTSRRKYNNSRRGALLILANLSSSHMVFLLCCLPSIAYQSIMKLTYEPWVLTDVVCRLVPFFELFLLGVTVFSFCALSIDRLRSAGKNAKSSEEGGDSCLTGACKLIVIWVGAMIVAAPEIFIHGTSTDTLIIPEPVFNAIARRDPNILGNFSPRYSVMNDLETSSDTLREFLKKLDPGFPFDDVYVMPYNVTTFGVTYQYQKCEKQVSLWPDPPVFLLKFIEKYMEIRAWWIFGFYFCLPVFFSLLSALVVALKLSHSHDKCLKEYGQYPVDGAVGTLTSHKGSLNRSNSVTSNQTLSSEAQQLMNAENRVQGIPYNNGSLRNTNHRSVSPANSYPGGVMTPMIVRACNTPMSPLEPQNGYAQSPITSPSVTSQLHEVNGTNPRKSSSLPPHGRGTRGRSRMQKLILFNIARDRALNTMLVALLLAFSLTWLPQHIFHILFSKTHLQGTLDPRYVHLIMDICRYVSAFSFAVNPIVIYLSYKRYRLFLDRICCQCRCC